MSKTLEYQKLLFPSRTSAFLTVPSPKASYGTHLSRNIICTLSEKDTVFNKVHRAQANTCLDFQCMRFKNVSYTWNSALRPSSIGSLLFRSIEISFKCNPTLRARRPHSWKTLFFSHFQCTSVPAQGDARKSHIMIEIATVINLVMYAVLPTPTNK